MRLAALLGIAVTGIVYSTVLARIHEPHGWKETSTNAAFHYIVPISDGGRLAVVGPRPRIERRTIVLALGWPAAWIGYIMVYGRITKWYPYPFLDAGSHGYGRVIVNALAVVVVLSVMTSVYWLADQRLPAAGARPPARLTALADKTPEPTPEPRRTRFAL